MSQATRIINQKQSRQALGFAERVALFVVATHKARTEELLTGLSNEARQRAQDFSTELLARDSSQRQALLAHEFGARPDIGARLRALIVDARGPLRAALVAALPVHLRPSFPQFTQGLTEFSPATRALATRLVREVLR